jgi:hypothetical protein
MYKITCTYDGDISTQLTWQHSDALQAFTEFARFTDWGFADEYSTINLEMPDGKMYTKTFYRGGKVVLR